jgi:hypothetical protein
VNFISRKYGVSIIPISEDDFLNYFYTGANARMQAADCSGPFTQEIVDEGSDGCFGVVWHYNNGSTGFMRMCLYLEGGIGYNFECFKQ